MRWRWSPRTGCEPRPRPSGTTATGIESRTMSSPRPRRLAANWRPASGLMANGCCEPLTPASTSGYKRSQPYARHALVALAGGEWQRAQQRSHQGGRPQTLSDQQRRHQMGHGTHGSRMHRSGCQQSLYPGLDQGVQFGGGHAKPPGSESSTSLSHMTRSNASHEWTTLRPFGHARARE